jgi:TetR/AcrR family transcriptional repressor of nem operon
MRRTHTKDEIVRAGLEIMLTKGFNATGVEAILKQADVPKGSFYNFFPSKEEFGLAVIDQFRAGLGAISQPILADRSLPPLARLRKYFESLVERFEENNCTKGCLIGNLGLEMSDQSEALRQRLDEGLSRWTDVVASVFVEAQEAKALPADLDPRLLAGTLISSFEGALLFGKVKKSVEPLRSFLSFFFDHFLACEQNRAGVEKADSRSLQSKQ